MNPHLIRHTIQEDFYSSKNHNGKDTILHLLGDKTAKNSESVYSTNQDSHSKNNIEEILRCFICFGKVKNAQLCPNCSKLCCAPCIKKWLTEQKPQCPHCRCSLRVSQLVNCRFVHDITMAIEQSTKKEEDNELCSVHQAKMSYFCKTCHLAICADCAMFGTEHKGHEFEHITKVYESHVDLIKNESQVLQKRLKDLTTNLNTLETTIDKLKKAKEEKVSELKSTIDQMNQRLDQDLKNKLVSLVQQKANLSDEIEFLHSMQTELTHQINQSAKSQLIGKSSELVKMLKEINSKPLNKINNNPVAIEFTSEIVPSYDSGIFYLKPFTKLKQTQEIVYSDVLETNGLQWRLKIYPNGNGVAKGSYLSIFLEMIKGVKESSKYEYRVEMINQKNPSVVILREFASEFENGECWGYNRFFKIDLLEKEGYLTETDTIVLRYYIRAPTYFQQCQDQRRYIQQLEKSRNQSNVLIAELKEKLKNETLKNQKLVESSKTSDEPMATLQKLEANVEEERTEQNNIEPQVQGEEVEAIAVESECIDTTNRKEGCNKDSAEQKEEFPLDSISTQKKEEPVLAKYSSFEDNEDKIQRDDSIQVAQENEDKSLRNQYQENSEDSTYQELFANGLEPQQQTGDREESESEEEEKYTDKIKDLIDIEATEKINLSDHQEPTDEETGDEAQLGLDELRLDAEDTYEDLQKSKRNNQLDDIDLDNICEKKIEDDIASHFLANHDIDQIEIDKFLTYENEREISYPRTQVKTNLLPNFDAERKKDKKSSENFTASIHQFSESLMKKIESIKSVNEKFRKSEYIEERRKPLSQLSKPNTLNFTSLDSSQSIASRNRDYISKGGSTFTLTQDILEYRSIQNDKTSLQNKSLF